MATTLGTLAMTGDVARAWDTPYLCDPSDPKYYCSTVDYYNDGYWVNIQQRIWKGSRDGLISGSWRVDSINDWADFNYDGIYDWQAQWGPTSWRSDSGWSPWYTIGPVRYYHANVLVRFNFHHIERLPGQPEYHFYSGDKNHWIDL